METLCLRARATWALVLGFGLGLTTTWMNPARAGQFTLKSSTASGEGFRPGYLESLLTEATRLLPSRSSEFLPESIRVSVRGKRGTPDAACLALSGATPANIRTRLREIAPEFGFELAGVAPGGDHIAVRRALLALAEESETNPNCASVGKDIREEVINVLVHESAHLIDRRAAVSKDPDFYRIAGFKRNGLLDFIATFSTFSDKNHETSGSPDSYEQSNRKEFFAVNFSYFSLDPEYRCRRPVLYRYFESRFGRPVRTTHCDVSSKVLLDDSTLSPNSSAWGNPRVADLNPVRIYRIDYLLAAPGKGMESRFGHSMLRLVICDPRRDEVGPACLKDLPHHVVASFRAQIDEPELNQLKGMVGTYPSRLYLMPFASVVDEYTVQQYRDLQAFELSLSNEQKRDLVELILDQYWSYVSNYKFFTRNCATETRDLLRAIPEEASMDALHSIFPKGVLKQLKQGGAIATSSPVLLPSAWNQAETAFSALKTILGDSLEASSAADWIQTTTAKDRRARFDKAISAGHKAGASAFAQLEFHARQRALSDLRRSIGRWLGSGWTQKHGFSATALGLAPEQAAQIKDFMVRPLPTQRIEKPDRVYGIPLSSDWTPGETAMEPAGDLTISQFQEFVKARFPKETQTAEETRKNYLYFLKTSLVP